MGDPKQPRRTYETPQHPWQADRIQKEAELVKKFGFRNKKEIWKMTSLLRRMKQKAKELIAKQTTQAEKEREQLITRLYKLGVLQEGAKLEHVLDITPEELMQRRLQTVVLSKNLARSINQARQFIKHRHIMINNKIVDTPSYLVNRTEETAITYAPASPFIAADHPERIVQKKPERAKPVTPQYRQRGRIDRSRRPQQRSQQRAPRPRAPAS